MWKLRIFSFRLVSISFAVYFIACTLCVLENKLYGAPKSMFFSPWFVSIILITTKLMKWNKVVHINRINSISANENMLSVDRHKMHRFAKPIPSDNIENWGRNNKYIYVGNTQNICSYFIVRLLVCISNMLHIFCGFGVYKPCKISSCTSNATHREITKRSKVFFFCVKL